MNLIFFGLEYFIYIIFLACWIDLCWSSYGSHKHKLFGRQSLPYVYIKFSRQSDQNPCAKFHLYLFENLSPQKNTQKLRKVGFWWWKLVFFGARGGLQTERSDPHFLTRFLGQVSCKKCTFFGRRLTHLLYTRGVFGGFGSLVVTFDRLEHFWVTFGPLLDPKTGHFWSLFGRFWTFLSFRPFFDLPAQVIGLRFGRFDRFWGFDYSARVSKRFRAVFERFWTCLTHFLNFLTLFDTCLTQTPNRTLMLNFDRFFTFGTQSARRLSQSPHG